MDELLEELRQFSQEKKVSEGHGFFRSLKSYWRQKAIFVVPGSRCEIRRQRTQRKVQMHTVRNFKVRAV